MSTSVSSNYNCGIMSNNLQPKKKKKKRRRRNSKLLSLHFYLQWCTQCGKSFCIGVEARNPSLVWKTKTTKEKMESFHFVNWDQSYFFIPIFILLACIITIMSNNLLKKEKNSNLLSLHFYLWWCTQYGKNFYFGRWSKESIFCLEHITTKEKMEWHLHVNWDKSYSLMHICILLACIITIMSNNLGKKM